MPESSSWGRVWEARVRELERERAEREATPAVEPAVEPAWMREERERAERDRLARRREIERREAHRTAGDIRMHAYDHLAYQYEADYHCGECTSIRFGRSDDPMQFGQEVWIPGDARDREGNPIHVIGRWDDDAWCSHDPHGTLECGTCGIELARCRVEEDGEDDTDGCRCEDCQAFRDTDPDDGEPAPLASDAYVTLFGSAYAGGTEDEGDEEPDDDRCRSCGDVIRDLDGWNGRCGDCADSSDDDRNWIPAFEPRDECNGPNEPGTNFYCERVAGHDGPHAAFFGARRQNADDPHVWY